MENLSGGVLDGHLAVVRGGGDIATGVVQKLWRAGLPVVVLESECPTTIRRSVALSSAVREGLMRVEDVVARRVNAPGDCPAVIRAGEVPVLVDPLCESLPALGPSFLVDAIIAKRNLGTNRDMAPVTVALGPGFSAPKDADAVIETMRGHNLGRLILHGDALANTGVPGELGGKTYERVVHAPVAGRVAHLRAIGDVVQKGEGILRIDGQTVPAPLDGVLRGLIAEGITVPKGMKCADVDPRPAGEVDVHSISDKARCIGGAVLEACFYLGRVKKLWPAEE